MAEMAIADGITHVVGTPHANQHVSHPIPQLIKRRRDELQEKVSDRLKLATGCDFHLSFENLQDIATNIDQISRSTRRTICWWSLPSSPFRLAWKTRCTTCSFWAFRWSSRTLSATASSDRSRSACSGWLHQGCYVQVTAHVSSLGKFGAERARRRRKAGWRKTWFTSSQATPTTRTKRPLRLREAFQIVPCGKTRRRRRATALFHDNPLAAFEGRPLPYDPEQPEVAALRRVRAAASGSSFSELAAISSSTSSRRAT